MLRKFRLDFLKDMGHEFINWASPSNARSFFDEWPESIVENQGGADDYKYNGWGS